VSRLREFTARVQIGCSPEQAFDFVADHRNVPLVLEGVSRWEPLSSRTRGTGARYEVEMRTLGVPLTNRLVLDAWDRPRTIGWHSESGLIRQQGRWTFTPVDGGVEVELRIGYQPPGALVGSFLAARADAIVRRRLERALEEMRARLEVPE